MRVAEPVPAAWAGLDEPGDERREDACAPEGTVGTWELVRCGASPEALASQRQVARTPALPHPFVMEHVVTNLITGAEREIDGCACWTPGRELLEAKRGYFGLIEAATCYGVMDVLMDKVRDEAGRQLAAAGAAHAVQWHLRDQRVQPMFGTALQPTMAANPNLSLRVTPAAR